VRTGGSGRALGPAIVGFGCLLLLIIPVIQPLLSASFTCGTDNSFHLWRAFEVERLMRGGVLFSRWAPDMAHGLGYPLFVFHAPASAYVAAVLHLTGLSWSFSVNGTFILGIVLGGLAVFLLARDLFGATAGLVAGVAYIYAPYQAYDAFNRGSMSEAFAWAFPPLILWAVHRWAVERDRRFLATGALSLAALILTHQLFAFLLAPLLVAWVVVAGVAARDWRVIGRGAALGLLGLGLAAFLWLPGLAERGWVQTDRLLGTWVFEYGNNFLRLRDLFAPPRATDPSLINDWPPKALGLAQALSALLPLVHWRRMGHALRRYTVVLLALLAGFVCMTLPISLPLWDRVPLLAYVQFPWRFLGPAALCAALLAAIGVSGFQSPSSRIGPLLLVLLLVLANLGWLYPDHCSPPRDVSAAGLIAWERASDTLGSTAKGEYLPVWVHRLPDEPGLDAAYRSGSPIVRLSPEHLPAGTRVFQASYGPLAATVELEAPSSFRARYLAFYYPGWRVWVDGRAVPVTPTEPEGLISFEVPAGRHTIDVRFGETPLRLAAEAISLLSLIGLLVLMVISPGHRSRDMQPRAGARADWPLLAASALLLAVKLGVIDRVETPLRRANLVDGHLRDVDVPAEVTFGDEFALLGYDALPAAVPSGARFEAKTYWRALQPGGPRYGVTVNVVDAEGRRWQDPDIRPPRWHRTPPPTGQWPPDGYALIALSVPLKSGTPPGTYTVELVAFELKTLAPLTAHDADGQALGPALPIGQIVVRAPRHPADPDALGVRRRLDARLGPLTLLDAHFDRDEAAPGDAVLFTVLWRAEERPVEDLSLHLALLASDGSPAAEYELPPTVAWHPTSAWKRGDVWRGQHVLHLPARLDDGDYTWRLSVEPAPHICDLPSTLRVTAPTRSFTLQRVQRPIDVTLGEVTTLTGYELSAETLRPGTPLTVTLFWRAEAETRTSYHVFLHLISPQGELVAQSDGIPAAWTRPTTGWIPGEYVSDRRMLDFPADAPAGEYALFAGMYVPGGERLSAPDGADVIPLTTLTVEGR